MRSFTERIHQRKHGSAQEGEELRFGTIHFMRLGSAVGSKMGQEIDGFSSLVEKAAALINTPYDPDPRNHQVVCKAMEDISTRGEG